MTGGFGGSMGGAQGGKGKRPINVKFEIPYFTTSGIQVRYLKIIEPKVCCTNINFLAFSSSHLFYSSRVRALYRVLTILSLSQRQTSGSWGSRP